MKNLKFLLILAFLTATAQVRGQQDIQFTQYMFNKLVLNPAYAGAPGCLDLTAFYRNQWTGFEGAPRSFSISANMPFANDRAGFGITMTQDEIGISSTSLLKASYAYRIHMDRGHLAFGLSAEIGRQGMAWENINPITFADQGIPYTQEHVFLPNFGVGVYFESEHLYAGISVPHLLENEFGYEAIVSSIAAQKRHYYGMIGGVVPLSDWVKFRPGLLVKYQPNSPFDAELNTSFLFADQLWVGGTYRLQDSYDVMAQYLITPNLRVGYSYDFTLTRLRSTNSGTHELMVGFNFCGGGRARGLDHPRYF